MANESDMLSLIVSDGDTQPLAACSLSWRWTDPRWAEFSPEELASLQCLTVKKATQVYDYLIRMLDAWQSDASAAAGELVIATHDDPDVVRRWLAQRWPDQLASTLVSWDPATAVAVPWGLFIHRWDDFCYPSSDDVVVAVSTGQWILEYAHHERMTWQPRPA